MLSIASAISPKSATPRRGSAAITCASASPSPAWPGRAVAPDMVKETDGPKVGAVSFKFGDMSTKRAVQVEVDVRDISVCLAVQAAFLVSP
jgi:hypothetical protein